MIKSYDQDEFLGQIIDVFEDWLTLRHQDLPCSTDSLVIFIKDDDYTWVKERLKTLMQNWNVIT